MQDVGAAEFQWSCEWFLTHSNSGRNAIVGYWDYNCALLCNAASLSVCGMMISCIEWIFGCVMCVVPQNLISRLVITLLWIDWQLTFTLLRNWIFDSLILTFCWDMALLSMFSVVARVNLISWFACLFVILSSNAYLIFHVIGQSVCQHICVWCLCKYTQLYECLCY